MLLRIIDNMMGRWIMSVALFVRVSFFSFYLILATSSSLADVHLSVAGFFSLVFGLGITLILSIILAIVSEWRRERAPNSPS